MKLFEECVNSQQMRNRRYGGFIFTTPIFFIQITKKFGDVTSMTYIRFGLDIVHVDPEIESLFLKVSPVLT